MIVFVIATAISIAILSIFWIVFKSIVNVCRNTMDTKRRNSWVDKKILTSKTGETFLYDYSLVVRSPEYEEQFARFIEFKERYGIAY